MVESTENNTPAFIDDDLMRALGGVAVSEGGSINIFKRDAKQILNAINNPIATDNGWRDIATAPKDGGVIRLFDPNIYDGEFNFFCDGHWTDLVNDTGFSGWEGPVWNAEQDCFFTSEVNPTHWQPLPPAPKQKGDA